MEYVGYWHFGRHRKCRPELELVVTHMHFHPYTTMSHKNAATNQPTNKQTYDVTSIWAISWNSWLNCPWLTGCRGVISLALLCKLYILTYMKDARIQERRRARTYVHLHFSFRTPAMLFCGTHHVSQQGELLRKLPYSAVGLHNLQGKAIDRTPLRPVHDRTIR